MNNWLNTKLNNCLSKKNFTATLYNFSSCVLCLLSQICWLLFCQYWPFLVTEYICKKEKNGVEREDLLPYFIQILFIYTESTEVNLCHSLKLNFYILIRFSSNSKLNIEFEETSHFLQESWKIQDKINKVNVKDRWCRFTSITVCYGPNWSEGQHTTTGSVGGGTKVRHRKVCCSIQISTPSLSQLSFIFVTCPAVSLHELQPSGSHSISASVVYMSHP